MRCRVHDDDAREGRRWGMCGRRRRELDGWQGSGEDRARLRDTGRSGAPRAGGRLCAVDGNVDLAGEDIEDDFTDAEARV